MHNGNESKYEAHPLQADQLVLLFHGSIMEFKYCPNLVKANIDVQCRPVIKSSLKWVEVKTRPETNQCLCRRNRVVNVPLRLNSSRY